MHSNAIGDNAQHIQVYGTDLIESYEVKEKIGNAMHSDWELFIGTCDSR